MRILYLGRNGKQCPCAEISCKENEKEYGKLLAVCSKLVNAGWSVDDGVRYVAYIKVANRTEFDEDLLPDYRAAKKEVLYGKN